jgi:hypothetical protein
MLAKNFHFTLAFSQLERLCTSQLFFMAKIKWKKISKISGVLKEASHLPKVQFTPTKSLGEGTWTGGASGKMGVGREINRAWISIQPYMEGLLYMISHTYFLPSQLLFFFFFFFFFFF